MDITPIIPANKKIIQSYSDDFFKVNNEKFYSNIIVVYDEVKIWNIDNFDLISPDHFNLLKGKVIELLIIGSGMSRKLLPHEIKNSMGNFDIEIMNTGAACRTYNVLLAEGRLVAAALILPK